MLERNKLLTGASVLRPHRRGWAASKLTVLLAAFPALLAARSDMTGVVFQKRDAGFVPVAAAMVEVRLAGDDEVLHRVETGSMGRYYISGLAAGEFLVTVTHPRYSMAWDSEAGGRTVRCPSSGLCEAGDFEMMPAGELEVSVVDSLGFRVEEASVEIQRLNPPGLILAPVLRTAVGIFRVSGMAPGRYRVEAGPVERRGIVYHRAALELDYPRGQQKQSVRLVLSSEREYRVAGRILGLQATDDRAMVLLEGEGSGATAERRLGAPVNGEGHFAVNGVPAGSYSVKLVWEQDSRFDLANGGSRVLGTIEVQRDVTDLLFSKPTGRGSP